MKKLVLTLIAAPLLTINTYAALDFVKGANVKEDVPPRLLRNSLRKGAGMIGAARIVISKDAKIPPRFQKKFDELKLSGETVPTVGEASPDVIFIKGF